MLKDWNPEYIQTPADRQILVASVIHELTNGQPGDHTTLVAGDILVVGEVDSTGLIHVYEAKILRSTESHEDQHAEGAAFVARERAGGLVS